MKERPILMSAPMVRAILEGRKSQTRRMVKLPRWAEACNEDHDFELDGEPQWPHAIGGVSGCLGPIPCPYGQAGDLLWVRESCCAKELTDDEAVEYAVQCGDPEYPKFGLDGVLYPADAHFRPIENSVAASEAWGKLHIYRGKSGAIVPPIHMPRWASRLTLRISSIRVERLQEISENDALAEGADGPHPSSWHPDSGEIGPVSYRDGYRELWESINGKGSWDANPWVWVIEFERIEQRRAAA